MWRGYPSIACAYRASFVPLWPPKGRYDDSPPRADGGLQWRSPRVPPERREEKKEEGERKVGSDVMETENDHPPPYFRPRSKTCQRDEKISMRRLSAAGQMDVSDSSL